MLAKIKADVKIHKFIKEAHPINLTKQKQIN